MLAVQPPVLDWRAMEIGTPGTGDRDRPGALGADSIDEVRELDAGTGELDADAGDDAGEVRVISLPDPPWRIVVSPG